MPQLAPDHVLEDLAHVVLVERAENGIHGRRADLVAAFDELDQLVDDRSRLVHPLVFPLDREPVPAQPNRAEAAAERQHRRRSGANSAATSFETKAPVARHSV